MDALSAFLIDGGPVVWTLLLFSIAAVTIILIKFWQLWLLRPLPGAGAREAFSHLEQGENRQALILIKGQRNPRTQVLSQSLTLFDKSSLAPDDIRAESMRLARQAVAELGTYLRPLEVIASLAPLLGLFGTVLGMIEAFQAMEAAGSQVNPSVLSGGIWEALLTTAVGLGVAIPVSLAHSWFERYVEREASEIQNDLEHLFTLKAKAVHEQRQHQAKHA